MDIKILYGVEGARQAEGIVVIIDVLRAATVEAYLLDKGVKDITPVATKAEAFAYKEQDPALILVGEEDGIKIPGFDIGNSPAQIRKLTDLKGKSVIHRSSTGTQGLVNAHQADTVIFGSFVVFSAIYNFILDQNPEKVSLVAMESIEKSEDYFFAQYLKDKLLGKQTLSMKKIVRILKSYPDRQHFFDPQQPEFQVDDFYLSLKLDTFSFFPILKNDKLVRFDGNLSVTKN